MGCTCNDVGPMCLHCQIAAQVMAKEQLSEKWPEEFAMSMAPFIYTARAKRTELSFSSVTYRCWNVEKGKQCTFQCSFDPTDMSPELAKQMFVLHFNQSH